MTIRSNIDEASKWSLVGGLGLVSATAAHAAVVSPEPLSKVAFAAISVGSAYGASELSKIAPS